MMKKFSSLSLCFLLALASVAAQARPLLRAEQRDAGFTGNIPDCSDPGVLGTISARFQQKESEYWHSDLEIASYDRFHQSGFRSNGSEYIPRRYCTARVQLNNHRYHHVTYWIAEDLGILGYTYGVGWCVSGLDRDLAYAPNCKAARH